MSEAIQMANDAASIITEALAAFPDAAAKVRIGKRDVIETALCTGLESVSIATGEGLVDGQFGVVRYLYAAEPTRRPQAGDVIEFRRLATEDWQRLRVMARNVIGGAVRLNVQAEFE